MGLPDNVSDHVKTWIILGQENIKKVRGFWRMNNTLLKEENCINIIYSVLQETIEEYYDDQNLELEMLVKTASNICPVLLFELLCARSGVKLPRMK